MRLRLFGTAFVLLLALAGTATSGAAQGPVYQAPQGYYLALGDSIAYGFQPDRAKTAPPSAFDTGYVDVFAARLRRLAPAIRVVDYGCPGESTVTFVRGGCEGLAEGAKLHDPYRGSQLGAAVSFLRAHPDQVGPVTLTLFGNDWFPLFDTCKGKLACVRERAPGEIAAFGTRLTSILQRLRAAAPAAEMIVTGAWNIDPGSLEQLRPVYRSLDAAIARAASASRARFADTLPVFNPPGSLPARKARLCAYSFICSKGDPHPTDAGYRAIADAVAAASGYPRKA
jgi:lysophospholipase L1-like esterase